MQHPDISEEKTALRRRARGLRAGLGVPVEGPGLRLARVLGLRGGAGGRVLAGYWPLASEADPRPAMAGHGGVVCLPVVVGKGQALVFRRWAPGEGLRPGPFGVSEPEGGEVQTPDIVIVPLLAFDRAGRRLGYGGGFYDRTLAALRARPGARVEAIGLAFAAQEVARVPTDSTDQSLDLIVTEQEVIPCP